MRGRWQALTIRVSICMGLACLAIVKSLSGYHPVFGVFRGWVPGVNYLSSSATTTLPHLVVVDVDSRTRA